MVEEAGSSSIGEELCPITDQSYAWDSIFQPYAPDAVVDHLGHGAPARPDLLGHRPDVLLRDVDDQVLHRLERLPVLRARDDLRLAHLRLEALAPHHLDEDRQL